MKTKYHAPSVFGLKDSVGSCGTNNSEDVKQFQKTVIDAGYQVATGRTLYSHGRCDPQTVEAILWYQRLLTLAPTGLLHPTDGWYSQLLEANSPHWRPQHTVGILRVPIGQITYDAEGVDYVTAVAPFRQHRYPYFSRVLHWPGNSLSGVTLGRGYDMGRRHSGEITATLKQVGIEEYKAIICARAAFLKGNDAEQFVRVYGPLVGEITHQQQNSLFLVSYREKLQQARNLYSVYQITPPWETLDREIQDVLVDIIYQGFHRLQELFRAAVGGKRKLAAFIMDDAVLRKYESQRQRVRVLR
jgi:hypothetical protein